MNPGARTKPDPRTPAEVREYEGRVWDLAKHLIHPAFLYVVLQVVLWGGLERHPAYRGAALSFWERTAIHAIQFIGAWGVFYGTLLRDMRLQTRVVTIILWLAAAGAAYVWIRPSPDRPEPCADLHAVLIVELAAGFLGWVMTMVTWLRAKARHAAEPTEAGRG